MPADRAVSRRRSVTAAGLAAACALSVAAAGGRLWVELGKEGLSLDAEAVPLAEIVAEVGRQAGFETTLLGDFGTPVTVTLREVPLAEGLDRLLGDADRLVIYAAPPPVQEGGTAGRRVARLWLFSSGGRSQDAAENPLPDPLLQTDSKARSEAVLRLSQADASQEAVVDALGRALREDPDALVRSRAAVALGGLRDPRALPALASALDDESFSVRAQVIQALGQSGGDPAAEMLGSVLFHDPDPRLRTLAAQALHHDGSPLAQLYLDAAADDPVPQVRAAASKPPPAASRLQSRAASRDRQ